jgi:predicted nucleic acid-binding protein
VASDLEVLELAFELADRHRLQTYDSVIVASAARAGCAILFSEDMQHGFEWQGVTIVNPFA